MDAVSQREVNLPFPGTMMPQSHQAWRIEARRMAVQLAELDEKCRKKHLLDSMIKAAEIERNRMREQYEKENI